MMSLDPRTPVIVGVSQQLQRIDNPLEALAPVPFIANAIREATKDAGLSSVPNADSIRVVSFLSWRYRDPARFIAEELGITTRETVASSMGGNSTQSLINATALEIQSGDFDVVILCGGETSRTRKRARAAEIELPWPVVPEDVKPNRIMGEELVMNHEYELSRRIVAPIQIYPIFESAIRAASGRSVDEHNQHLGKLWSNFSKVAETNPYAWIRKSMTPEEIITTGPRNRMIGLPYTKVMNSNNDVDQSAAIIMCSVAAAERMGISKDKWVFPIAGTDCHEHRYVSERDTFADTPAVKLGGKMALDTDAARRAIESGVGKALGVDPLQVAQASLLGVHTTGFPVSPLTPAQPGCMRLVQAPSLRNSMLPDAIDSTTPCACSKPT